MRIALGIEYAGSAYCGWQKQPKGSSVQQCVEQALAKLAGNQPIHVQCSGRTDSGVHAINQVVHFDTDIVREERAWVLGTNSYLPQDIRIHWARQVEDDFHARFGALERTYHYIIHNQPIPSALWHDRATWVAQPLNVNAMHEAAQCLLGEHDFSAFRASGCQAKSPIRVVHAVSVINEGDRIRVSITANAFLYHMVRNIVGSLLLVGKGKQPVEWMHQVQVSKNRRLSGATAPAQGLYYASVRYPQRYTLGEVPAKL